MTALREEAFIDASKIESLSGLTYGITRPVKSASNPVLTGTASTYQHHVVYVSAVKDPVTDEIKLFYGNKTEDWSHGRVSLALSDGADGVTFTKPNLGLHTLDGNTNNNCVLDTAPISAGGTDAFNYFAFVSYEDGVGYVALGSERTAPEPIPGHWYAGIWTSPDGVTWTRGPMIDTNLTTRDAIGPIVRRADGRWIVFMQSRTAGNVRSVGYWLSDTSDLATTTWAAPVDFMLTGPSVTYQYYSFGAWREGEITYAVICIYDGTGYYQTTPPYYVTTTTADRQFKFELWATSNADGVSGWTQVDANWVWSGANAGTLDSTPGEWDYGCMVGGGVPIRVGDDWRYYYGGAREQHHPAPPGPNGTQPWTQRQAGFMSVPYRRIGKLSGTGNVVLDPVTASASSALTINSAGAVEVELLHPTTGAVLAGYARADCDAIPADTFGHTVTWNGSSFTPVNYKAKVYLTAATVYYVEIAESAGGRLVVDAGDDDWAQVGTSITVSATGGVASSTLATIYSVNGGTIRFAGPDASKFEVSADGVSWAATLVVAAGAGDVHLRVTPDPGDVTLSALIGIPA